MAGAGAGEAAALVGAPGGGGGGGGEAARVAGGGGGGEMGGAAGGQLAQVRRRLARRKPLRDVLAEGAPGGGAAGEAPALKRSLGMLDLVAFGVASTLGAGLYVVTGKAAEIAGPAVPLSFLMASLACLLSALCYSELATRVPVAGSAYSYTYVTLGEGAAWFIGWNLTLEYMIAASAVARGWAGYMVTFLGAVGVEVPLWLYKLPLGGGGGGVFSDGSPLALVIIAACTGFLLVGARESSKLNISMTVLNVGLIVFIVAAGASLVRPENLTNWDGFFPADVETRGERVGYGMRGVFRGSGSVFFSYVGFDAVCTLAEELTHPHRDLPRATFVALAAVTVLYVVVSTVIVGMVPFDRMDLESPLSSAFSSAGKGWAATLVALGATVSLGATVLCSLFGQPRIFYRMAQDGLLFRQFGEVSRRTQVPTFGTVASGAGAGVLAFFLDLDALTDMISIGSLVAFGVVCMSVLILRLCPEPSEDGGPAPEPVRKPLALPGGRVTLPAAATSPAALIAGFCAGVCFGAAAALNGWPVALAAVGAAAAALCFAGLSALPQSDPRLGPGGGRVFVCPLVPLVPCLGMTVNLVLIMSLKWEAVARIAVWTAVGFAIYFLYGMQHSVLNNRRYDRLL